MSFKATLLAIALGAFAVPAATFAADQATSAAPATKTPSRKEAKAECLKQDPNLKGGALKKCIKDKRMPASK